MKNLNFLSNQSDFGLENGSGLTREWLGIDSTVSRKLFTLLFVLLLGFGQMWGATNGDVFERVSAVNDLSDGDEIIFVNQAETYACGTTQNSNNRTPVSITVSNHKYTYNSSHNVQVFVVKKNSSGKYGFHTGTGYLYSKSSSKNQINTNTTAASTAPSGTAAWSLSVSSYVFTMTNVTNTSYYLAFNGTDYFAQYSSGYIKPYIYKKQASSKTLSSISVSTEPTKKKYVAGENFDPTGLVITRNYSSGSPDTYTYASHTSEFSFTPSTSTALTTSNTSVSITYGGKSVSQSINVYNVTMQARDEDGNAIPAGGPGAPSRTGKSITPAADANNYVFKEWSISGASLGSSKTTKSNTITSPTGAVTVTAVYHKPITITYKANGQDFTTQTYGYGGTLAFPASEPDGDDYSCTGKTFTGWVAEANKDYKHASTAPTYATASGSVTAAATYYAVFANASGNKTTKTDNITRTTTGVTANSTNYSAWSGKTLTSSATYAGQSAGGNSAIQLRNQSPSGVISTASGGTLKKITITWNSNTAASRYVTIFGKATAYSQTSDLYNNSYKGTELGTIIKGTSTELNVTGTYNYVGILASAAIYIDNIAVQWEVDNVTYTNFETTCCTPLVSINGSFNRYHLKIFHHIIMSMFISLIFKC